MLNTINKFRQFKGRQPVQCCDGLVSHYCKMHCLAMAKEGKIFHAPECYLQDWQEAVAVISFNDFWKDQIIFDVLGSGGVHTDIMLNCNTLAFDYHIHNWVVYLCLRGK
jgi:hypothetical protein